MMCLNISLHILNENLIRPDQDEIIGRPVKNYRDYGYGLYCYNEFEHAQQTNNLTKIREMFANNKLTITSQIHSDTYYYDTSTQFIEWYVLKDTGNDHTKYRWHVDGQVMNYEAINIIYKDWDCDDLYEVSVQRNINHDVNSDYLVQQFIKSHSSFKRWVDYMTNNTIQTLNTTDNITIYAEYFDKELSYCWIAPSPIQTPFETIAPTPIQTPIQTPFQTPFQTIAPTPIQTPFQTIAPTPIQTPIQTPFETIAPTPIQTPIQTPFETIAQTIALSPIQTIAQTIALSPIQTIAPSPFQTIAPSPFQTIAPSPFQTIAQTPFETIAPSPFQTPHYTISNKSVNANATNLPKNDKNKPNKPLIIVVASIATIAVTATTAIALKKKFKCCLSANFEDQHGFNLDDMSVVL